MSFDTAESGPQPLHSVRCPDHTLEDAFILSSQKINTDICFVVFCWFQNILFGLLQAAQHRQIQLHHSTTAAFYSQHWTRLANIQTNTQARLELTKHGLQSFFEGHPSM